MRLGGLVMSVNQMENMVLNDCISSAREAQKIFDSFPSEKLGDLVKAIALAAVSENSNRGEKPWLSEAGPLKRLKSVDLTGTIHEVLRELDRINTFEIFSRDGLHEIIRLAKPVGVIGALLPSSGTHEALIIETLLALKGKNAVVFSCHPSKMPLAEQLVLRMRDELKRHGLPGELVALVPNNGRQVKNEFFQHCDILIAAEDDPMYMACFSRENFSCDRSGRVIIADESANIPETCMEIWENHWACNSPLPLECNLLLVHEKIYGLFMALMLRHRGYMVSEGEKAKLKNVMWIEDRLLPFASLWEPQRLLRLAGVKAQGTVNFLLVPQDSGNADFSFSGKTLSNVVAIYKYGNTAEAIDIINRASEHAGVEPACEFYSSFRDPVMQIAAQAKIKRLVLRRTQGPVPAAGLCGNRDKAACFDASSEYPSLTEHVFWNNFVKTVWIYNSQEDAESCGRS